MSSEDVKMEVDNAVYAAVDMEKKKRNRSTKKEMAPDIGSTNLPMYAVVHKKRKSSSANEFDDADAGNNGNVSPVNSDTDKGISRPSFPLAAVDRKGKTEVQKLTFLVVLLATILGIVTLVCFIVSLVAITEVSSLKSEVQASLVSQTALNTSVANGDNDELLDIVRNIRSPGQYDFFPTTSCAAVPPSSPSGYYWVRASNGSAVRVYCDMTRSCGGVTGGWMRVADWDMTDSTQPCPSGLRLHDDGNNHTCRKIGNERGCSPVITINIPYSYSKICGRIIAYQVGSMNAFAENDGTRDTGQGASLDGNYVDGVSLTHGNLTQHTWTFAAGLDEVGTVSPPSICPCNNNSIATSPPPFVGDNYFCEAGVASFNSVSPSPPQVYINDPLWDAEGCIPSNPCCSFNNPPWFYRRLPHSITDDIEMRVCRDENSSNEDVAISIVELYVQ